MKLAIEHRWECTGPDLVEFDGRQGDRIEQCMACRRMRVLNGPDKIADARVQRIAEPAAEGAGEPITAPVLYGYACREHLASVNWRGKGCVRCARELADRITGRRGGGKRGRDED